MNPLKNLFSKVFETAPSADAKADASKDNGAFEWNPEEETVAPTSAQGASWKRGGTADEAPVRGAGEASHTEIAASAHTLPSPTFERSAPTPSPETVQTIARPSWAEPAVAPTIAIEPLNLAPTLITPPPSAPVVPVPLPSRDVNEAATRPAMAIPAESAPVSVPAPAQMVPTPGVAHPILPLSDFEDVYRKAGIKSPVHGYGVERVYRLLTSRRLAGLDRSIRRSALLTALDAAGVPPSDVSQDAVLRRKALAAYEAEKALELQSLRSRNESRAEALQDTVETFTRQKQSQIERLAQGSTAAVRAQSDLEIRKRMEQDRLYRSLAYFVEPLPTVSAYQPPPPRLEYRPEIEARPVFIERALTVETLRPEATTVEPPVERLETVVRTADLGPNPAGLPEPEPRPEIITPRESSQEEDADTRPMAQSGLEMALRAAAQEAKNAGWGQTAIVQDSSGDAVDALRKLREAQKADVDKTEPES